jgi:HAE1 family hydrophobic/amphiphilic exporter-1
MYTSTEISGSAAGYSSGTAIKVIEVAAEKLPRGYDIDWAGISADEVSQGIKPFGYFLSVWVLFTCLAAQYKSFILPLSVILSLPAGIFGAFLLLKLTGLENNISGCHGNVDRIVG